MCKEVLKEISKLAEISLCITKDLIDYGFDGESMDDDIETAGLIQDNLTEILTRACSALKETE